VPLRVWHVLLVAAVAFGVYANSLGNGFLNDDEHEVLLNPWIRDPRSIPTILSSHSWGFLDEPSGVRYYRPLKHLFFLLVYRISGLEPWGFHLLNVLFHVGNSLLVLLVAARLPAAVMRFVAEDPARPGGLPVAVPLAAALLFAAHPIHSEAVNWVAAIVEISFTFFFLLSFVLRMAPDRATPARTSMSALFYFLAMLCKETAVTLPALLAVYDLAVVKTRRTARQWLTLYGPHLVAAVAYFVLRWVALARMKYAGGQFWDVTPDQFAIGVLLLFGRYVEKLFLPVGLSFWHRFDPDAVLLSVAGLSSLVAAAAFLWAAWRARKTDPLTFFCLALFVIPLAPAFLIPSLPGKPFAERYAYLPSMGFVILAAVLGHRLARGRVLRQTMVLVLVATTAGYGWATVRRNRVWKDAYTLYVDTTKKTPDAPVPPFSLGTKLLALGHLDEAIAHFRILTLADPKEPGYQIALGNALLRTGRIDEAILTQQRALALDPTSPEAHTNLGIALVRKGSRREATNEYRQALELDPKFATARFNLAGILADDGLIDEALEQYREAARLEPENAYYQAALGIEYAKLNRLDEAIELFETSVRLDPQEQTYRNNLERAKRLVEAQKSR